MKIFFRRIHLYMGLATGIVIMITCFTGAILVFEKELQQIFHKERYFTKVTGTRISADSLTKITLAAIPEANPGSIKIYSDPGRTAEVVISRPAVSKSNTKTIKEKTTRLVVFIDPYNGKVIEIYDHRHSFFYFIMDLHRWMLGGDTGKLIVGSCTLLFIFILLTGIILWFPKNKAILKQRLKIRTDAGLKRINHDYHIVLGFYTSIFLFVFAFTALAWSFTWFNKAIFTFTGSKMEKPVQPKNQLNTGHKKIEIETAFQNVLTETNNASYYNIGLPKDSTAAITITLLPEKAAHESATDTYYIDAYSGKISGIQKYTDKNRGQRIRATFKPIHVSSIYGIPSKIVGVIVCLLGTFFPLTGIIMWVNRTWKRKYKKRVPHKRYSL